MISASAPGSIMVTGEHAVVHGHAALVAAIDQRAHVTVTERSGTGIEIHSALGNLTAPLSELRAEGPLRFVVACLLAIEPSDGLRIQITSDIDPTLGLGSSAAVTIAALGALAQLTGKVVDLHAEALAIVRTLQGR
ncbi:MAG: mevalonate kinase, partial [Pseudomonadota bacterium]